MGPVEVERKVRQLDNDVQSIYTMLSAIQGTQERHTNRLGELAVKFDNLQTKLDDLAVRFDNLETRFDSVNTRFDSVNTRFDSVNTRFDSVDTKIDTVLALLQDPRA